MLDVQISLKIAASSFCVYLFGLESLAAKSEGFLFYTQLNTGKTKKQPAGIGSRRLLSIRRYKNQSLPNAPAKAVN